MSGKQSSLGRLFGVLLAGLLLCLSTMGALAAGVDLMQAPSHVQRLQTEFDGRSAGIMRLGSLSSDANLRSISAAPTWSGQDFDFVGGVGEIWLPYGTKIFLLTLWLSNSAATMVVNQSPITSGGTWRGQLPPNGDAMTVEIKITAEDGVTERVYRITVTGNQTPPVQPYSLTVRPSSLPAAVAGTEYPSTRLTAGVGVPPYRFSVKQGALPRGMGLTPEGVLSGTPQESGRFSFTVSAVDANSFTGDQTFDLDIDAPQITLSPTSLPPAMLFYPYAQQLAASGGTPPYRFTSVGGPLPPGLSLGADGLISGAPTEDGIFPLTFIATDSLGFASSPTDVSLTAEHGSLSLDTHVLSVTASQPYSRQLLATGGIPPYAFSVSPGELPDGLTLAADGTLSGMATETGFFPVNIEIRDAFVRRGTSLDLTVHAPDILLSPSNLPTGVGGSAYPDTAFSAQGGQAPYTYTVVSGVLPRGMTLSAEGMLSGAPETSGRFPLGVQATDANGFTGDLNLDLDVDAPQITLSPSSLPTGVGGSAYPDTPFSAQGGQAPYTYAVVSGVLPAGMTLNVQGMLSGTPETSGHFPLGVQVMDAHGFAGDLSLDLTIDAPNITLSPSSLPDGVGGSVYPDTPFSAQGGRAPYDYTVVAGAVPRGMSLAPDGTLSGTPELSGDFPLTVSATDTLGFSGTLALQLNVDAPVISLVVPTLPSVQVDDDYGPVQLGAAGGTGPYSFAIVNGRLHTGLSLDPDGRLSGVPKDSGERVLTVSITDQFGFSGSGSMTIDVAALPVPLLQHHVLEVVAGNSAELLLTTGAQHGPFSAAAISQQPLAAAGVAELVDDGYRLRFQAAADFSGSASLQYTLTNKGGVSAPGTVSIQVVARPDPSKDAEVIGLVRAQTDAAKRLATAQIDLIGRRLEQLHHDEPARRNRFAVQVDMVPRTQPAHWEQRGSPALQDALNAMAQALSAPTGSGPAAPAGQLDELAFWSSARISFGERDDGLLDLDHTQVTWGGGADFRFSPAWTAGVGLGYGEDKTDVGDAGTRNRARSVSLALYGSYRPSPGWFVDSLLGYGRLDFDSRRHVTDTTLLARGERSGGQVFAALTGGWEWQQGLRQVSPYVRLAGSRSRLDPFTEYGADWYNLQFERQTVEAVSGSAGLRLQQGWLTNWGQLTPRARVEYSHDFEGSSAAALGYADLGGAPYRISAAPASRDLLSVEAGVGLMLGRLWTLGLDYRHSQGLDGDSRSRSIGLDASARF